MVFIRELFLMLARSSFFLGQFFWLVNQWAGPSQVSQSRRDFAPSTINPDNPGVALCRLTRVFSTAMLIEGSKCP